MAIKGIEDRVTALKQKASKTVKQQAGDKHKVTVYLKPENVELLAAYAYQTGMKKSAVVDKLLESQLRPKVRKELLKH